MTELCGQLQTVISDYFNRYPNTSVNSLALKSGVGATTLRRIMKGGLKGDPAPHTILNIASAVTKEKRLSVLVNMFDGPMGALLKDTFSPFVETSSEHKMCDDLNVELQDFTKYMIYKCAANSAGVKSSWVIDNFGKAGLEKMKELISSEFLNGGPEVFHASEKDFSLDVEVAAKHLPEMVKFYKASEIAEGKNLFYSLSESISEEGIAEVKKIQKEAIQNIYRVMNDTKFAGDIHYMALAITDTMSCTNDSSEVIQ